MNLYLTQPVREAVVRDDRAYRRAITIEDANRPVRRDRASHTAHGTCDPCGGAIEQGPGWHIFEQAAIARLTVTCRAEHRRLPAHGRSMNDRHAGKMSCVGQQESGWEVVGGVDHHSGAAHELGHGGRCRASLEPRDIETWSLPAKGLRESDNLGVADTALLEQDLPVQVSKLNGVLVDEHQRADSGQGQRPRSGRADTTSADQQN